MFSVPLGLITSTYTYAGQLKDESKDVSNFLRARDSRLGVKSSEPGLQKRERLTSMAEDSLK